jgi:hypothetical protein
MISSPEIWRNASASPKEIPQAPVYAPNLVELEFYELRLLGILGSSRLPNADIR